MRAIAVTIAFVALMAASCSSDADGRQTFMMPASEEVYAENAAALERSDDGVRVEAEMPTPEPGSYTYPSGDMVPPWATPHPDVSPGSESEPETFTLWLIAFNYPDKCTEGKCDSDDLGSDTAALGGVFQADGRIADASTLAFSGTVRLGQPASHGAALENPMGAEIHLAVAGHGKALTGADLWRQLNGPVGNPSLWWVAEFP